MSYRQALVIVAKSLKGRLQMGGRVLQVLLRVLGDV